MTQAARELIQGATRACVQCGACMQVCPVYQAGRREELSARGKLRLLEGLAQGWLEPGRDLARAISACLLCGRCSAACPSGVEASRALGAGRAALTQAAGAPFLERLLLAKALPQPQLRQRLAQAGLWAQPLAQALVPLASGLRLRLPGLALAAGLPPLAHHPFLNEVPQEVPGPAGSPRLGLFVGCVTNYLRPTLAAKAVRLLSRVATVVIPAQGCCGLPAFSAGLAEPALDLARDFVRTFAAASVDKVVTVCGSCAHTLARRLPELVDSPPARHLAAGVLEISQVLAEHPRLLRRLGGAKVPVAMHDPCHLKVGLGVSDEPRHMLEAAGVHLAPLEQADACCGGGGLFALHQPRLSQTIFRARAQGFALSGADILATSCSGCFLQWRQGLDPSIEVKHPIELVDLVG